MHTLVVALLSASILIVPAGFLVADESESPEPESVTYRWVGVTDPWACLDWSCAGVAGDAHHTVRVPVGFDHAELRVEWNIPIELRLTIDGSLFPQTSHVAVESFSKEWDLTGHRGTFELTVMDPAVLSSGTGVAKPVPFTAVLTLS